MGRDDMALDEIKVLNGIDEGCDVNWHDARPDFSSWSSDYRMEVSVAASLGHIHTFMHPQVIITDDPSREDAFFTRAARSKAMELGRSLIELPTNAAADLMWITRLDSASLSAWQTTYVDILIHAPLYSSGSLLRLLKSIEKADYFGFRRPHLTIELPAQTDTRTTEYLEDLVWPPIDESGAPHVSQVTLRRRIPRRRFNAEDASVRLIESFYPARPINSHVLVLSPQAELSRLYFHFLMYNLLENKYSISSRNSLELSNLMGISLELPSTHLNDSEVFRPPEIHRESADTREPPEAATPFLWQSPNSNAALYFGDKWIEFHSFLTSRVSLDPAKAPSRPKLVSEMYPAWMEYLLELMRARGYTLLYPNFLSSRDSIATLHHELYQPPEEFAKPKKAADAPPPTMDPEKETFDTDPNAHRPKRPETTPLRRTNLISILPRAATTQELFELPLLSYEGNEIDASGINSAARAFTNDYRRHVSNCKATSKQPNVQPMRADDLFCTAADVVTGRSLGDFQIPGTPRQSFQAAKPVIKDDSALRQNEFEAHLNRQAGQRAAQTNENAENKRTGEGDEKAGEKKGEEQRSIPNEKGEFPDLPKKGSVAEDEKRAEKLLDDAVKEEAKKEAPSEKPGEQGEGIIKQDVEEKAPARDRGW
ncbi:MAG: hypothetical protein Q9174_002994 [Haloplaca sp. 1 TL-2023]